MRKLVSTLFLGTVLSLGGVASQASELSSQYRNGMSGFEKFCAPAMRQGDLKMAVPLLKKSGWKKVASGAFPPLGQEADVYEARNKGYQVWIHQSRKGRHDKCAIVWSLEKHSNDWSAAEKAEHKQISAKFLPEIYHIFRDVPGKPRKINKSFIQLGAQEFAVTFAGDKEHIALIATEARILKK